MPVYRLSAAAVTDIARLLAYTYDRFGPEARGRYQALLATALRDIAADPMRPGSVARPELGNHIRSYHLRHSRDRARSLGNMVHRPRHLLLYRASQTDLVGIGRVLHDSMEIDSHLPDQFGDE